MASTSKDITININIHSDESDIKFFQDEDPPLVVGPIPVYLQLVEESPPDNPSHEINADLGDESINAIPPLKRNTTYKCRVFVGWMPLMGTGNPLKKFTLAADPASVTLSCTELDVPDTSKFVLTTLQTGNRACKFYLNAKGSGKEFKMEFEIK